jgi:hypothetical protein
MKTSCIMEINLLCKEKTGGWPSSPALAGQAAAVVGHGCALVDSRDPQAGPVQLPQGPHLAEAHALHSDLHARETQSPCLGTWAAVPHHQRSAPRHNLHESVWMRHCLHETLLATGWNHSA